MSDKSKTLPPRVFEQLKRARKANWGVRGCLKVLQEDATNSGSMPLEPGVFIRLEPIDAGDLMSAIEICSEVVEDVMEALEIETAERYAESADREIKRDVGALEEMEEQAEESEPKVIH